VIRWLRCLASSIALALLVITFSAPASGAHSALQESSPGAGQRVDDPPKEIQLRFDQTVTVTAGSVRVLDANQRRYDAGLPKSQAGGSVVSVKLNDTPVGPYVVAWRAVSQDGHPIRGAFTFQVGDADQSSVRGLAARLLNSSGVDSGVRLATTVAQLLGNFGMVAALGSVMWAVAGRRGRSDEPFTRRLGVWGAATASVGLVTRAVLLGPTLGGRSLAGLTDGTLLNESLASRSGRFLVVASVASGALAVVLRNRWTRPGTGVDSSDVMVGALALAMVVGTVIAGHGASGPYAPISALLQTLHVVAAASWMGLIVVLLGSVLVPLRNQALGERAALARSLRVSTIIGWCVAAIVASGVFASWRQVRSVDAARETDYGKTLLVKIALVTTLLLLGARNRVALRRIDDATKGSALRRLGKTVGVEVIVGVIVVVLSTLLSQTVPSREVFGRPVSARTKLASATIEVSLQRSRTGRNEVHVLTLDETGRRRNAGEVKIEASLQSASIGPLPLLLRRAGPGHYVASSRFDIAGEWEFAVQLAPDEFSSESGRVTIALR
jgi:copper transport protein